MNIFKKIIFESYLFKGSNFEGFFLIVISGIVFIISILISYLFWGVLYVLFLWLFESLKLYYLLKPLVIIYYAFIFITAWVFTIFYVTNKIVRIYKEYFWGVFQVHTIDEIEIIKDQLDYDKSEHLNQKLIVSVVQTVNEVLDK